MWHGGGQSGKTWEETPDCREGFQTIFLWRNFTVHLINQPRRGKAGKGTIPGETPALHNEQQLNNLFRLGLWPNLYPGVEFSQSPEALNQFFRAITRDTSPADADVSASASAKLLDKIGPSVLVTHSQGAGPGWRTVAKTKNVKAIVSYEPGSQFIFPIGEVPEGGAATGNCPTCGSGPYGVPLADFLPLTKIPIVLFYGDNIASSPSTDTGKELWRNAQALAYKWADAVNKRGGDVTIVKLPSLAIKGNTQFPMSDTNNVQVADKMSDWLRKKGLDTYARR